jgi:hypothetical protein
MELLRKVVEELPTLGWGEYLLALFTLWVVGMLVLWTLVRVVRNAITPPGDYR